MLTYAKRLVDERDHLTEMANTTADRAATEDRDLTDTERDSLKSWQERCGAIDSQLEEHKAQIESQRSWANLRAKLEDRSEEPPPTRRGPAPAMETRSWGQVFTESEAFKTYGGRGSSELVEMPGGLFETRAAIDLATLGGAIRPHIWEPPSPTFRNPLLEVVGRQPVSVGAVEYFYFKPIPPANAPEVAEGQLKPEAPFTVEEKAEALKTYAHYKAITRQALEDFPRIRSLVDDKLRVGLFRALEAAGVTALTGNTDIVGVAGDNLLEAIRGGHRGRANGRVHPQRGGPEPQRLGHPGHLHLGRHLQWAGGRPGLLGPDPGTHAHLGRGKRLRGGLRDGDDDV